MTTTTTTAGELELAGRRCQLTVSPQTPEQSLTSAERKALEFPVLSDAGNAVARRYGLVFTQSEAATACATTHRPLQATGGDHRRHAHRGCRAGADDRHRTRQAPRLVQIVSHDGRIRPMARPLNDRRRPRSAGGKERPRLRADQHIAAIGRRTRARHPRHHHSCRGT